MSEKLPIGVHHSKGGRFRSVITVSGKQYHLGTYEDVPAAKTTYVQARKMTDDLLKRIGTPEVKEKIVEVEKVVTEFVEVPVEVRVEVPRPSILSKLFMRGKVN